MLSEEFESANADAEGPADSELIAAGAVADLAFGSEELAADTPLRSSGSVAAWEAAVVELALLLLVLLFTKGELPFVERAAGASNDPAQDREGPAASGCASAFWCASRRVGLTMEEEPALDGCCC